MADNLKNVDLTDAPWVQSPDFRSLYANQVRLGMTYSDFQLNFALTTAASGGTPINLELATVYISPQQAKALAFVLGGAVALWEKTHKVELHVPAHLLGPVTVAGRNGDSKQAHKRGKAKE